MTISKRSSSTAILLNLIITGLVVLPISAQARIKCWENNDGIRECGKNVPPEYSQKGYEEISSQGITIDKSERALTAEERLEQERLAAIEEEKEAKKAEIAKQDKALLDTFGHTDDIQITSDGKIAALDSTINLANKRIEKIQSDLDKRIAAAAAAELAGKQPPEDLLKDIESLRRQVKNHDKFIEDKRLEQEEIRKEYAQKIERFKQLNK